MRDILWIDITSEHQCFDVLSERNRMLDFMKNDLDNIEWTHMTGERIKCLLFQRCIDRFGEHHIDVNGFPKSGIY